MKKIFKWTLFAVATLSLAACGISAQRQIRSKQRQKKQRKSSASDSQVEVSLKGGQYIKPPVLNDSEDGTYLALQLEFKNVAKESINVSDSDITIYDAENNKVKLQSGIYDQTEAFQLLKSDQLAQDKKLTGYIVFPVEKGKKYEVQYERKTYSLIKKSKPFKICGGFFSV